MKEIRIEQVCKSYNGLQTLDNTSLVVPSGQFFALLGPSGCGKTTLLRSIAGFETVDSGLIYLGNTDITHMPIHQRRVNTVFQNYALFPHLSVFENVAYSLRIRKVANDQIRPKVYRALEKLHLTEQVNKSIQQLSGGQKQRVALARAIINEPDVLLLDEPLAALDLKLREKVLIELIDLQSELKTTFIYVTHDQFEALTVADQMAIMNFGGKIEQIGTPKQIYEFPTNSFVAQFVGTTNSIKGVLRSTSEGFVIEVPGLGDCAVMILERKEWMRDGAQLVMSIRPEKILISKKAQTGFSNYFTGVVESIVYHGRSTQYNVRLKNNFLVQVFEQNEEHFEREVVDYEDQVQVYWQKENVVLLEK